MANTYKCVRLEPLINSPSHPTHAGKVCSVVIGLTGDDGSNTSPGYVDGVYTYPEDSCPTVEEFGPLANALVSQFAADNDFISNLDGQIEAAKTRPVPAADFETPEITVDTTVEATVVEEAPAEVVVAEEVAEGGE